MPIITLLQTFHLFVRGVSESIILRNSSGHIVNAGAYQEIAFGSISLGD